MFMSEYRSLNHALDVIENSTTDKDVWDTLFSFVKMCRIEALVYHYQPPPGSADFAYPLVVKQSFAGADSNLADAIDHIFNAALRDQISIASGEFIWRYTRKSLSDVLQDSHKLDIDGDIKGVSFPVHGPLGRTGFFSLVFDRNFHASNEDEIRVLKWACQNTHQAICKIKMLEFESSLNLTDREIEILSWIARGKSNSVIADILNISHHTVNTYVRRIFLKTNTNDRTSACLYGISNGFIQL